MESLVKRFLDSAIERGLLAEGQAHRVALAAELGSLAPATPVSGGSLGRRLGISRAAVHKQMQHLLALGFAVEPVSRTGYQLARPYSDLVVAEAVLPYLLESADADADPAVSSVGMPFRYIDRCPSTNLLLKQAVASAPEELPTGMVVVTDEQTGGRGRLGRTWVSGVGKDLTFSVLVRPALTPARAHLLSLAAALAVAETVESLEGLQGRVGIKWPNDVMLGDGKVCGILVEGSMDADRLQWAIIGIGLNVNSDPAASLAGLSSAEQEQWRGRPLPSSVRAALGTEVPRAPLLAALLRALARRFAQLHGDEPANDVLRLVRDRDVLLGRQVQVYSGPLLDHLVLSGEAAGIGPEGQLLVAVGPGEVVPVFAGDVTLAVNPQAPVG